MRQKTFYILLLFGFLIFPVKAQQIKSDFKVIGYYSLRSAMGDLNNDHTGPGRPDIPVHKSSYAHGSKSLLKAIQKTIYSKKHISNAGKIELKGI